MENRLEGCGFGKLFVVASLVLAGSTHGARAEVPLVMLDAGHGGSNLGVVGPTGVTEKRLALALVRQIGRRLEERGIRVGLTRDRDTYMTLRERVDRANRAQAACFVSVHANGAAAHERGVATYVLSRESADVAARAAARKVADRVQARLVDLRLLAAREAAAALAVAVQTRLVGASGNRALDRGVHGASFDVLAGLTMPGVLVEVGFLDHPVEGRELARPEVTARLARAVADGIFDFLQKRSQESSYASQ